MVEEKKDEEGRICRISGASRDADVDVRLSRRILRDMNVRHRPLEYIIDQYFEKVKPMHEVYVEPYKKYADIIIPHNRNDDNDFRILGHLVETYLRRGVEGRL